MNIFLHCKVGIRVLFFSLFIFSSVGLEEYHSFHPSRTRNKRRPVRQWECPPSGRRKINIDGAYCSASGQRGVGVVVIDEDGRCIAAFARHLCHASSAPIMEVETCRAGLLIAIHQGWVEIEIESGLCHIGKCYERPKFGLV